MRISEWGRIALPFLLGGCASEESIAPAPVGTWLSDARVLVSGHGVAAEDCRTQIFRHNENTDLVRYAGAIFLVHRTALSQILGPNSSLVIYRSDDEGRTFVPVARIEAPVDRDLRDPHFYEVGGQLYIKALTRLPVMSLRDSDVDTVAVMSRSTDGATWSPLVDIGPHGWSFWRIRESAGVYYSAAYEDGDKSVALFSSTDGQTWTRGADVYTVAEDTPLETELTFLPGGELLALVRMDGTDEELLGDTGRLRTKLCTSSPPYDAFSCPAELEGQRLDGPLGWQQDGRLFVVARKHLQQYGRKRTAIFEITGLGGAEPGIREWGELPSAGDTSYAGAVRRDDGTLLVSWYSGDLEKDEGWAFGIFDITDIWVATVDLDRFR